MASSTVALLTSSSALTGTDLFYGDNGVADVKVTATQIKTWTSASPTLVTPALGTPSAGVLSSCSAYPQSALTGLGTNVSTALGVNVGSAGAFVTFNGALGTPSSGTLTNATGLPIAGITGLGTSVSTALAVAVGSSGAFVTKDGALGTPSSGTLTSATGLPVGTGISGLGTGVATALAVNVGTSGAPVILGGALGSPSSAGTLPAHTLGGTISGGGNQLNNIIIGTSTPLAGSFTTMIGTGLTLNEVVGASALTLTGATQTSSFPVINATQTWNNSGVIFTGIKLNVTDTASSASSLFFDFQIGGSSKASILKSGQFIATSGQGFNFSSQIYEVAAGQVYIKAGTGGSAQSYLFNNRTAGQSFRLGSDTTFAFSSNTDPSSAAGDTILTRSAAATLQFGAADAASPVAQTTKVQSVVAGTADTAGAAWTLKGSLSTGTGASGDIILQTGDKGAASTVQNAGVTALTLKGGTAASKSGSVIVGSAALATTATDGYFYIPTCAGTPTGVPTAATGRVAMIYDTTAHQFWFYDGAWLQPKTPAAAAIVTWQ